MCKSCCISETTDPNDSYSCSLHFKHQRSFKSRTGGNTAKGHLEMPLCTLGINATQMLNTKEDEPTRRKKHQSWWVLETVSCLRKQKSLTLLWPPINIVVYGHKGNLHSRNAQCCSSSTSIMKSYGLVRRQWNCVPWRISPIHEVFSHSLLSTPKSSIQRPETPFPQVIFLTLFKLF